MRSCMRAGLCPAEQHACTGVLDAYLGCQTAMAVRAGSSGFPNGFPDVSRLPKDAIKGLLASAWSADMDAADAQQAKLAALRVHVSMLLPSSADASKTPLPFTNGGCAFLTVKAIIASSSQV